MKIWSLLMTTTMALMSFAVPAYADDAVEYWVTIDQAALDASFYGNDPAEDSESLYYILACGAEQGGGPELTIIGDDRNTELAQLLPTYDPYAETPAATLVVGKTSIPVPVYGYRVSWNDLNVGWDASIEMADLNLDLLKTVAAGLATGPVSLNVAHYTSDMPPRHKARASLLAFLKGC